MGFERKQVLLGGAWKTQMIILNEQHVGDANGLPSTGTIRKEHVNEGAIKKVYKVSTKSF